MKKDRTIAERLAEYIVSETYNKIPRDVIDITKLAVLDSIGCVLGAHHTKIGKVVTDIFRTLGGRSESKFIGTRHRSSCLNAAFVNSTLANALDFDDTYSWIGHPGATVVPPAIALGEKIGANGKDILSAIVLGYEVSVRIGLAVIPTGKRLQSVWGIGTWQTFGAVTAAAKLLRLTRSEIVNALAIAGSNAPVPSVMKTVWGSFGPTMVKNNYGSAAAAGVLAALLAQKGFNGPRDIFDGDSGFWVMYGSDQCSFEKMTENLGKEYKIKNLAFKPFSSCRMTHAPITAALNIIKANSLTSKDIEQVVIDAPCSTNYPFDNYSPRSTEEAAFSQPYSMAMTLAGIPPGPDWFDERNLKNRNVLNLAKKIKLVSKSELLDPTKRLSKVEIRTTSGHTYSAEVEYPKGEPQNPMSKEELEEKFKSLAVTQISKSNASKVVNILNSLEQIKGIKNLTRFL